MRSGADLRKNVVKERRHQISGFQASPYLKIYILRADDKDTYKATERQKIRAWIRDNAASTAKGKGGNHDAFEWLIIHAVVPDTTAASEPRWRESSTKDPDELKERKQGMKLPGKSTRTVFDKLRSDFNESGKGSIDRVAQIRLTRAQMPAELLPTPALPTTIEESNEERASAWNDLMGKFNTLILGPFDLRVRQYESDVAEQETRRSMPGFNFCTFFIHKEGLAKALESIGLVEDALVIYDELSLGLETVIRDLARGQAQGTATTFAPYTHDFKDRIVGLESAKINGTVSEDAALYGHMGKDNLEVDYRERIVRSDISIFDFFSYLFARQKALILRIANANSAISFTKDGVENFLLISEVCWRAMSFVHDNARTLRHDLSVVRQAQWEKQAGQPLSGADIESLVCSWTYTVAGRILDETESSSVENFSDLSKSESMSNGSIQTRSDTHLPGGVSAHPHRTTSLPRKSRVGELQGRMSLQSASESDLMSPRSSTNDDYLKPGVLTPGLLELVTYRAELLMMQRRMLELLAKQRGWQAGWATLNEHQKPDMEDVDLDSGVDHSEQAVDPETDATASSLTTPALASFLTSKETFYRAYERLSDKALRLFVAATQTKTAESIMGDLAILKSQQGDYEYAVSYFGHVLPLYAAEGWSLMEDEASMVHAHCLKQLKRGEEYITVLLTLLAKVCGRLKASDSPFGKIESIDGVVDTRGILPDLVGYSRSLGGDITRPAEQFFSDIRFDAEVIHFDDKDGFVLRLHLRHLLEDDVELSQLSARLVHADDSTMEIWLTNSKPGQLTRGSNSFDLQAHVNAFGPYLINGVVIQAENLHFFHDFSPKSKTQPTGIVIGEPEEKAGSTMPYKQPWVFVYPLPQAFDADIRLSKNVQVDKMRYLEIELDSGWNDIESIDLQLKPASAGLRLHLADALLQSIEPDLDERPGEITLGSMEANSTALVKVPYSLEQAKPDIVIRFEANFITSKGTFSLSKDVRLLIQLALDVEVNDMFQLNFLLSRFSLRNMNRMPLNITAVELTRSSVYDVEAPQALHMPMTVFDKQPINLIYKIIIRSSSPQANVRSAALALNVKYYSLDQLILKSAEENLIAALATSAFTHLSRLLLPTLHKRLSSLYSRNDIELAILMDGVKLPSFEDIGWREVINTLPTTLRPDLVDWLMAWHKANDRISLHGQAAHSAVACSITMSVDVPRVDYVHQISLSLPNENEPNSRDPHTLILGQPIEAHFNVVSTSAWSNAAIFKSDRTDQLRKSDPDFVLDIQANSDYWLVGGQRRAHFKARPDGQATFDVLLIPLRLGAQSLPTVDIQPAQAQVMSDEGQKQRQPPGISCETNFESAGQVVQVVRGLRTTRVSVPESALGGRPSSRPSTAATAKDAG